jgi:hypothetical protein
MVEHETDVFLPTIGSAEKSPQLMNNLNQPKMVYAPDMKSPRLGHAPISFGDVPPVYSPISSASNTVRCGPSVTAEKSRITNAILIENNARMMSEEMSVPLPPPPELGRSPALNKAGKGRRLVVPR